MPLMQDRAFFLDGFAPSISSLDSIPFPFSLSLKSR